MNEKKKSGISRREFARRAAVASAAALAPVGVLVPESAATLPESQQPDLPKLSPEGKAEVEARIHAILAQYESRLSKEQKADIRRLCTLAQPPLDRLREYALENADQPAVYLKPLVEREKRLAPASPAAKPAAQAKKS